MATIVFFPEGAHGPTNNCAGIGAVLRERGHRVVFILEESFAGTLEARGFEERLMRLGPPPEQEEVPGQFWIDFIHDTAPVFRKPTIEQLGEFVAPTFEALCDGSRYVHGRLLEIIDELDPDVIVEDNVVSFPALAASGRRWVRIVSCNPLEVPDPALAPVFSGYPEADRSGWEAFREEFRRTHADLHASFDEFRREAGAPPLPGLEFMDTSPYLNIYGYPDEVDYRRSRPLDATWHNVQTSVRTSEDWELPEHLREGPGALLYLSLGSLGSADVELMQRLVDILGETASPRDRLQGPARRADPPARQHVRRGLSAAARDPAAGRPRDHARRQQHDLRGAAPRQAHGRAADLLGSVRQRAAHPRDRARRAPRDLRVRGRGADRGGRPAARRHGAAGSGSRRWRGGLQSRSGTVVAADLIEQLSRRVARPGRACRAAPGATRRGSASGRPPRARARRRAAPRRARRTARWPPTSGRGLWKISSSTCTPSERASPAAARSERSASGRPRMRSTAAAELGPTGTASQSMSGQPAPSAASSAKRCARASSGTSSVSSITGRPVVAVAVPDARNVGVGSSH